MVFTYSPGEFTYVPKAPREYRQRPTMSEERARQLEREMRQDREMASLMMGRPNVVRGGGIR